MRRASAIWLYDPTSNSYQDFTTAAGNGVAHGQSGVFTLAPGQRCYVGTKEWQAGILLFVEPPSGAPQIVPEAYDGDSDAWVLLPQQERFDDEDVGFNVVSQGYDFTTDGVCEWIDDAWGGLWVERQSSPQFPEQRANPPGNPQLFWTRLRNTGSAPLVIDRLLPVLYNTYTHAQAVARYIGQRDFDEIDQPFLTSIRERIRTEEDKLDNYVHQTFRLGMALNERHEFNAFGVKLDRWPVFEVTKCGVWTGSTLQPLAVGRNQDIFFDPTKGLLLPTRLSVARGLPWSRLETAWMRQPAALQVSYIYGGDFDMTEKRGVIRDIVNRRVAASLAVVDGETAYFPNSRDLVTKPEQVEIWTASADDMAMQLRGIIAA